MGFFDDTGGKYTAGDDPFARMGDVLSQGKVRAQERPSYVFPAQEPVRNNIPHSYDDKARDNLQKTGSLTPLEAFWLGISSGS